MTGPNDMGAPRKDDKDMHNKLVKMYLTADQKQWLMDQQKAAGFKSTSRFLYKTLMQMSVNERISFEIQTEVNNELQYNLRMIGNNINQSMAFAHSTGDIAYINKLRGEVEEALTLIHQVSNEIKQNKTAKLAPTFPI